MKFVWTGNACKIVFNQDERKLIKKKGEVTIVYEDGRHFVNHLMKIVTDIHIKYKELNPDFEKKVTFKDSEVKLK